MITHTKELNNGNPNIHTVATIMYRNPLTTGRITIPNIYYCPVCNKFFVMKQIETMVELQ